MLDEFFAIACDSGYFAGLEALLNSIFAYHGTAVPVFVFGTGFGGGELRWLETHPLRVTVFRVGELPHFARGMWEAKQQIVAHCLGDQGRAIGAEDGRGQGYAAGAAFSAHARRPTA